MRKFYLDKVNIERIPAQYMGQIHGVLAKLLAEYYQTHPIYVLNDQDKKQRIAKFILKDVALSDEHVIVSLKY